MIDQTGRGIIYESGDLNILLIDGALIIKKGRIVMSFDKEQTRDFINFLRMCIRSKHLEITKYKVVTNLGVWEMSCKSRPIAKYVVAGLHMYTTNGYLVVEDIFKLSFDEVEKILQKLT